MKQTQQQIENEWRNASIQFLASEEGRGFHNDDINIEIMCRYLWTRSPNPPDKVKALKDAYKRLTKMGLLR